MSAIGGIFWLDGGPLACDGLPQLLAAMAHRGPDGSGSWCKGPVGLGQQLLRTGSEPDREAQPQTDPVTGAVVVADARIDNRGSQSDAAAILSAYRKRGSACVPDLLGDFAFALYDPRQDELFCARDPMGVKPFYYYHTPHLFAFATEIKALLALPAVPRIVDEERVGRYLAMAANDRVSTFFKGIKRLPAGHSLVVSRDGISIERHWHPESTLRLSLKSDADYAAAFREQFMAAVRARARATLPVGATLSGGLDSSSVVCAARDLVSDRSGPLHTFSLVFPSFEGRALRMIDERPYQDAVIAQGHVEPHAVRGDWLAPLDDLERVLWHLDEPFGAPNLYLHWGMFRDARQHGVRVMLDGFDGDGAVSHGLGLLNDLGRAGQWTRFETQVRAFARHRDIPADAVLPHFGLPLLREFARGGRWIKWIRGARHLTRRFGLSRRDVLTRWGLDAFLRRTAAPDIPSEREAHALGLDQPLYQEALEIADQAAGAFGIEPRYPFFDRRLIEFCLALPPEQKFADGWTRVVMRRAMQGLLPESVQWRATKSSLTPNFLRGMHAAAPSAADEPAAQRAFRNTVLDTWRARARRMDVDQPEHRPVRVGPHSVRGIPLRERRA